MQKLSGLGFSKVVLKWIASYTWGRAQVIKGKNGSLSAYRSLNRGLPQGLVLGPFLFSFFIGDVSHGLDPEVNHIDLADELQIYVQGPI